jgi:hypothetical protein
VRVDTQLVTVPAVVTTNVVTHSRRCGRKTLLCLRTASHSV